MKKINKFLNYKLIIIIVLIFNSLLYSSFNSYVSNSFSEFPGYSKSLKTLNINSLSTLIDELNNNKEHRKSKFIIFGDNILNKYCSDINAYTVFEYYMRKNLTNAFYIINIFSNLYKTLLYQNKTKNLILFGNKNKYNILYEYSLNSKIIVASYEQPIFNKIVNEVSFIKYLYINHGITYYKSDFIKPELRMIKPSKRNIITSSPFEYSILLKKFNYSEKYIYKAGLARYDQYNIKNNNDSFKKCILVFFTYRNYNNTFFKKSLYKINIENFIKDESLINYLKLKNIDLIFVQHHFDRNHKKFYNISSFGYAKVLDHINLTYYISHCSLLITDFSSISFAFMFQNKPTLFYLVDYRDKFNSVEKKSMKINDQLQFGNYFLDKNKLIEKIKFYIKNNFHITENLKKKYESVFYFKYNITERIFKIINKII